MFKDFFPPVRSLDLGSIFSTAVQPCTTACLDLAWLVNTCYDAGLNLLCIVLCICSAVSTFVDKFVQLN